MEATDRPTLSVIIPAYNEADRIQITLAETSSALQHTNYEIIVVNDGSSDSTAWEAQQAAQENAHIRVFSFPQNRGKGAALIYGTQQARGDLIAFLDADLELHPRLILQFWKILYDQVADVVIGSKRHPESQLKYPFLRQFTSIGYTVMNRWLFGLPVHDTQTGIKLFRAPVIKRVIQRIRIERYAFDLELLVAINRFGYKIVEAPVILEFKRGQGGRLHLGAIAGMFIDTLRIFYRTSFWKWLDPSLRMKLWMLLFLFGVILGSFGLAHLLAVHVQVPEYLSHVAYLVTLRFLDTEVRDGIMIFLGLILVVVAGIQLNKGILAAFARADRGYTVDRPVIPRVSQAEIPPPPEL